MVVDQALASTKVKIVKANASDFDLGKKERRSTNITWLSELIKSYSAYLQVTKWHTTRYLLGEKCKIKSPYFEESITHNSDLIKATIMKDISSQYYFRYWRRYYQKVHAILGVIGLPPHSLAGLHSHCA